MKYCDLTLAYTETSGGIRTYIEAKRRYLREQTLDQHVLIVPGEQDAHEQDERFSQYTLASPVIPGCAPYRCFWRPDKLLEALRNSAPEVVELGSFFACPWAAFEYRQRRHVEGKPCLVSGFFHTDLADAYFGAPLRDILHDNLHQSRELLRKVGFNLADLVESGAEQYFGSVFRQCDLVFASSPQQIARLRDYGVDGAHLARLGVDLDIFHPARREEAIRARLGAGPETIVIVYGGRLDSEKHVEMLVDAFARLTLPQAMLLMIGEGPLRKKLEARARELPGLVVAPYMADREAFAALLASADLYATAGPHETFGLSVVEAQACGLPVVGVAAGALRERVVPGTGFLVPVNDAQAMADKLEQAARQRVTLGNNARHHVIAAGLGWEGTFRALFSTYQAQWSQLKRA